MYKKMIEQARKDGVASEKVMNASIESVDKVLEDIKELHPELYRAFITKQHELLYGPHYNELFAEMAVADICYTDADGKERRGAYWSAAEIDEATRGLTFPSGTTRWDKYVAFNSFKSDVSKDLDDAQVISSAYSFYFADEDFKGQGKIWRYMQCVK